MSIRMASRAVKWAARGNNKMFLIENHGPVLREEIVASRGMLSVTLLQSEAVKLFSTPVSHYASLILKFHLEVHLYFLSAQEHSHR